MMRNVFIIIKHEISTTLLNRSFWITAFLFPLLIVGINIGIPLLTQPGGDPLTLIPAINSNNLNKTIGFVDEAGIIQSLPEDVPAGLLRSFPNEAIAQAAVNAGEIDEYVLIPNNYLQSGQLTIVQGSFRPFGGIPEALFKYIVDANLTGDANLAALIDWPLQQVESHGLAPNQTGGENSSQLFFGPLAVLFVFFFLLIMSSGYMLTSVSREKENRTMEILLVSLQPRELMLGKILGLSVVALLQMAIWLAGGLLVLGGSGDLLSSPAAFKLSPGFVIWALLFFSSGYLLYASLMGAIGALAPNARETGHFTILILAPLMIPVMFNTFFINTPDNLLAVVLSLFPLSAPTCMITRLVATQVPFWQIAVSLGGLVLTTFFLLQLSARFFRADTLLSSISINWQRIFKTLSSTNS